MNQATASDNIPSVSMKLSDPLKDSFNGEKLKRWNTTNLGLRLGADVTSAATASALVAPIVCVLDRSIVRKVATGTSFSACLLESLKPAVTRPHTFLVSRPFLLLFTLYFSTYATANGVDTLISTVNSKPPEAVSAGLEKFGAVSAVNMSLCIYKDSQFAKMFGQQSSVAAQVPRLTYILFAVRDSMTIFASFNLPPLIAPRLAELPESIKQRFSKILSTETGRINTAQFMTPALMQIFSTPIHLFGLDLYNRQGKLGTPERVSRIMRDWGVSAAARMCRIIPPFGVGAVINTSMRRDFMEKIHS